MLTIISALFACKYGMRLGLLGAALALLISCLPIVFCFYPSMTHRSMRLFRVACIGCIAIFVIAVLGAHQYLDPTSLQVDRWSVIASFIDAWNEGSYPYTAVSHLGNHPGPMPFYFVVAAPFYAIGELSWLSVTGYILVLIYLLRSSNRSASWYLLAYLLTAPFVWWEIAVRSNIFTYTVLFLSALMLMERWYEQGLSYALIPAILIGLLLSTRSVYILPLILFFLPILLNDYRQYRRLVVIGLVIVGAFVMTFIPLIIRYGSMFYEMNPFVIQSSFLVPRAMILLFIGISIGLAYRIRQAEDRYYYGGLSLFIAIVFYGAYCVFRYGFYDAYWNSKIDLSYFLFCVPFLLYTLYRLQDERSMDEKPVKMVTNH